jgi:zinc protease
MKNLNFKIKNLGKILCAAGALSTFSFSQELPPAPAAPRTVVVPAVDQKTLPNGLKVAVVTRKSSPLVTVELLVKSGANYEDDNKAGLADMTASLLTRGTKTRSATQIAEEMEFLGASINAGAGWNSSTVAVNTMSDKVDKAMGIMADTVLNPVFDQKEIDLLKSQTLDNLNYSLKQPSSLSAFVASKYSFGEHPAGGTVDSINKITRDEITKFHQEQFLPAHSVLIFSGDITAQQAFALAQKYFGGWKAPALKIRPMGRFMIKDDTKTAKTIARILVVDLPNSGQASVSYTKKLDSGRVDKAHISGSYFAASVANGVLGGGYSARLNQEIRIKRGLSYGANSAFAWRYGTANFSTRTQTKNESAAEVVELVKIEIEKLGDSSIAAIELTPRKSVLTGNFGRGLETTAGLAAQVADLYSYDLPVALLNSYMPSVDSVTDSEVMKFASGNLKGGDMIIVGDAKIFMDDLKKRFPGINITVIKADDLDVSKDSLHK